MRLRLSRQLSGRPTVIQAGEVPDEPKADVPDLPDTRTWVIVATAAAFSIALYTLLYHLAIGVALAEPSFAAEIFPWVRQFTKATLVETHESDPSPWPHERFLAVCACLFGLYVLTLYVVHRQRSITLERFVFLVGAVTLGLGLVAPIMLSSDVFAYALYGRILALYGANPYAMSSPVGPSDPYLVLFGQDYLPSRYGPLWTLISGGLAWAGREHVGLTVLLFRAVAIGAALMTGGLLWSNLRRTHPTRTAQGLVFFLWNPLLVIETGLSGHNDAVMLAFVMFGIWLHLRGWRVAAVLALLLSAMVKFLTGMLLPLYVAMVLRQLASWKDRTVFVAKSVGASMLLCLIVFVSSPTGSDVPITQQVMAPDFYSHNVHELIFNNLRRFLGEDPDTVDAPFYFVGYWVAANGPTALHETDSIGSPTLRTLTAGDRLLVSAPQQNEWVRVYDPVSRKKGYVLGSLDYGVDRPAAAGTDRIAQQIEADPRSRETVLRANAWIRMVGWLLFVGVCLGAAFYASNLQRFLMSATTMLLASYFLIITQIWPWYIIWAVTLAAMTPTSAPARFAALLSGTVLSLYMTIGYEGSDPAWVFRYRSLPAFILPLAIFCLLYWRGMIAALRDRRAL